MNRHDLTASGFVIVATFLVGSSVAAASELTAYPITGGQALRYGVAALILLGVVRLRPPRLTLAQAARLLALAATGLAGFNVFLIAAVRETDAAAVGVIVGCVPVVLALAGPALEGRLLSPRVVAAAVVVTLGAAAVQWSAGSLSALGVTLALGALACEAAFSLLAVPLLMTIGPRAVATYACLFATPMLLGAGLALDGEAMFSRPNASELAALLYLAVLVTSGGFVLWYSAVRRLGVERAGLFNGLIPIAALASAAAIGASELTPLRLLGALTVGVGITVGVAGGGQRRTQMSARGFRSRSGTAQSRAG